MRKLTFLFLLVILCLPVYAQNEGQAKVNNVGFFVRLVGKAAGDSVFTVATTATLTSAQYKVWPNMTYHASVSGTTPDVSIVYRTALVQENGILTSFITENTNASVTGEERVILTSISNGPAVCVFVVTGVGSNNTASVKITLVTAHR